MTEQVGDYRLEYDRQLEQGQGGYALVQRTRVRLTRRGKPVLPSEAGVEGFDHLVGEGRQPVAGRVPQDPVAALRAQLISAVLARPRAEEESIPLPLRILLFTFRWRWPWRRER